MWTSTCLTAKSTCHGRMDKFWNIGRKTTDVVIDSQDAGQKMLHSLTYDFDSCLWLYSYDFYPFQEHHYRITSCTMNLFTMRLDSFVFNRFRNTSVGLHSALWTSPLRQGYIPHGAPQSQTIHQTRPAPRLPRSRKVSTAYISSSLMVCFHCPTPIPMPIPIPIQMANIIMYRTVSTEPIPIPVLMQMFTVPSLTLISVLIRWFLK